MADSTVAGPTPTAGRDAAAASDLSGKTVYAVDANNLIFEAFYALPEMQSPRGEHVGAVFGLTRDLLFLLEQRRPDYLFFAFDLPTPTFRHDLFPDYKGDRQEIPPDLAPQFEKIYRVLDAFGLPPATCEGFEADDVMATLARASETAGAKCLLVSRDKDLRQLLSDQVQIYRIRKNEVFDAAALAEEWKIRPEQAVDFQALVGDKVDNVPGVPLIGPKIAGELLSKFGDLDGVYAHLDEISGKKRKENLIAHRDLVRTSRELVRLATTAPIDVTWRPFDPAQIDREAVSALFAEFGFHRFADSVARLAGPIHVDADEPTTGRDADYQCVDTPEALAQLVDRLKTQRRLCIDCETTNVDARRAEIVGYAISWSPHQAYYIPVRGPGGESRIDPDAAVEALRGVLEDPAIEKVGQNIKYDLIVMRGAGLRVAGTAGDSMLASFLLDSGERGHGLDQLAQRYLSHTTTKIDSLIGKGKEQRRMDEVSIAAVTPYACEDADVALQLCNLLEPRLAEQGLDELYQTTETPLVEILAEMEYVGISVDAAVLETLSQKFADRIDALESEIHAAAGREFNIASPKQLAEVLFEEQGLPVLKKTKTGASTDAGVLEELAALHELPRKIIEYRQYAKLKGTYVDALPQLIHPTTGRIHGSFHQAVAATGRLSSSDPNLQNIPIRTEAGREIRSAFRAGEPGWKLLGADYSQIELRVLAHFSGDEELCNAFARGDDIHAMVAAQVFGVPQGEVDGEMRRTAKAVNFGVVYGQSPFGLSKQLGIPQDEAASFIAAYFLRYPGVDDFIDRTLADARRNGYVATILGRRRAIEGVREPKPDRGQGSLFAAAPLRQMNLPERTAVNTVIQGSAADLIKRAMIAVHRRIRREALSARMLLQIHDELVFEAPEDELSALQSLVVEEMTGVMSLAVPLEVNVSIGDTWADC